MSRRIPRPPDLHSDFGHYAVTGEKRSSRNKADALSASALKNKCKSLEDNLCCELQVERLARTQSRGAIEVADGVANGPVGTYGSGSGREINAIEDIKHLCTELQLHPLRYADVLDHGHIHIAKPRAIERIPAQIPRTRCRCGKRVRVDPLFARLAAKRF